jgi:hypothetical protein
MRKKSVNATRPRYQDKCAVILKAIRKLVYAQQLRGGSDFGFTMAQIAEEAGYARSSRFMDTLHCMCDDKLLEKQECKSGNPKMPIHYWFRLPSSRKQTSFAS